MGSLKNSASAIQFHERGTFARDGSDQSLSMNKLLVKSSKPGNIAAHRGGEVAGILNADAKALKDIHEGKHLVISLKVASILNHVSVFVHDANEFCLVVIVRLVRANGLGCFRIRRVIQRGVRISW